MGSKRKSWTSKEKMRIVLAGMSGAVEVSELCRREGVSSTQYYNWKRQLNDGAALVFSKIATRPSAKERALEKDLSRAKDVIAEITAENLELKKGV